MNLPDMEAGAVAKSGGPAYQQISEILRAEIASQVWPAGIALPNEKKLSDRFSVSIGTIRRAIENMERDGLVIKMQGLGTFVQANSLPEAHYQGIHPFRLNQESTPTADKEVVLTELTRLELTTASLEEAKALGLSKGDPIWMIEVQHRLHGQLVAYEHLCVSQRQFPGLTKDMLTQTGGNLYRLAAEVFKMRIGQMVDEVSMKSMAPHVANLFNKAANEPSLRVFRITHSMDDTPIEKREVWLDPAMAHYKARSELS